MTGVKGTKQPKRPTRREQARSTRLKIVQAAHAVFVDRGYGGARMTDIAAAAGVAVQTVYFTFHTKAELLQACYKTSVLGTENPTVPNEQPWHAAMLRFGRAPAQRKSRREGYIEVISLLDSRFGLSSRLDTVTATDLLLACGGTGLYRQLVLEYG